MSQSPMERFEDAWKAWARRGPRTAATDAARRLRARLDAAALDAAPGPVRLGPARGWLAAAAVALLAAGAWLASWPPAPAPDAPAGFGITEPQPLAPGVALIWLDAETPLYMTLTPPRAAEPPVEKGDPR